MINLTPALAILAKLHFIFDETTLALARCCAIEGKLSAPLLDQFQIPCFELAWVAADILAAETALSHLGIAEENTREIDHRLSLIFAVQAISTSLTKLEAIHIELGISLVPLHSIITSSEWATLRQYGTSTEALSAAANLMPLAGDEFAQIAVSSELTIAQESFRRFAADVVAPQAAAIHKNDTIVPENLLQSLREMGVFGLSIPEKFGGSAPDGKEDTLLMIAVTEALSEASLAAAGSLITRPEILSRALLAGGTEQQKQLWLPKIAAGEPLCAIAITEPDYGSDAANVSLKGTPTAGGWLLNGAKAWCTFAGKAGVLMVVVRTDPDKSLGYRGLSVMLTEKPSYDGHEFAFLQANGGSLTGKAIATIGYRGMHSFDLAFDNFFVPSANVIGEAAGLGKGFYLTMAGMVGGRMQTAARACGVMRAAIRAALQYTQDRKVFGAPLFSYPLTLAKLASMAARYAACRRLAYAIGARIDAGTEKHIALQASLVKLLACRSAEWVTREALQLFGGMGYAEETAVSRYFVDARVLSIFEGAEETLALKVVARGLMEQALDK